MIAVALVSLQQHFDVGVATSTWLISSFYLAAAVGQPVMGRLVDLFGPRHLFASGLFLVLVVSVVAPFAPGFWWLVVLRAAQGIGTSAAYPSAVALFRQAVGPEGKPPAGAMAALGVIGGSSAALGPVVGGLLIASSGWQAIFLVNVPLTIVGIVAALTILPRPTGTASLSPGRLLGELDITGIALFTGFVTTLLVFLLSLAKAPLWWLLALSVLLGSALILTERAARTPFLDLRGLIANRSLSSILVQQAGVNLIFYSIFFGLPIWLEAVRGTPSAQVGALMLPFTVIGLLVTPLAARAISRHGVRRLLIVGSVLLGLGTLMLQLLDENITLALLVLLACVMGIPNGLNNLGLQTGMFAASPPERIGSSGGLFQTFRYLGAILASSVLGVLLEQNLSSQGLHQVGVVIAVVAAVLILLAILLPATLGSASGPQAPPPDSDSNGPRAK